MDQWVDGWGGWIDRMESMQAVEYYAARKRSEALTQAAGGCTLKTRCSVRQADTEGRPACDSVQMTCAEEASRDRRDICGCLAVKRMREGFGE